MNVPQRASLHLLDFAGADTAEDATTAQQERLVVLTLLAGKAFVWADAL